MSDPGAGDEILEVFCSENGLGEKGEEFGTWRNLGLKCARNHFRVQYLAPKEYTEGSGHLVILKMCLFQKELCIHTHTCENKLQSLIFWGNAVIFSGIQ